MRAPQRTASASRPKDSAATEVAVIEKLAAPDLLRLDEIGNLYGTDAERIILSSLINARDNAMKPTILLSNLAKPELIKELGDRVADRMREGEAGRTGRAVRRR